MMRTYCWEQNWLRLTSAYSQANPPLPLMPFQAQRISLPRSSNRVMLVLRFPL